LTFDPVLGGAQFEGVARGSLFAQHVIRMLEMFAQLGLDVGRLAHKNPLSRI